MSSNCDVCFCTFLYTQLGLQGLPGGSVSKESAWNVGYSSLIPGLGRSSGEGNGNPLQCSCLENPMDGGVEHDRLQSMGSQRVDDWATSLGLDLMVVVGFQGGSVGKESACSARDTGETGSIPGLGRSHEERHGNPLQYSLPGESPGQRSLAGYSP